MLAPFLKGLVAKGEITAKDWYGVEKGWVAHGDTDAQVAPTAPASSWREQVGFVRHLRRLGGAATR